MFGIGETELIIIVVFAFMVFGPDKLPGMGRTIGRALRQFREAQEDLTQVVRAEVVDPLNNAMNEPTARRRAQAAAEAAADDADLEDADGDVAPKKQETFAERKARLKAEREAAAQERAARDETPTATSAAAVDAVSDADTDTDADADTPDEPRGPAPSADHDATFDQAAADDAPDTSAAALYALTTQRDTASPPPEVSSSTTPVPDTDGEEAGAAV